MVGLLIVIAGVGIGLAVAGGLALHADSGLGYRLLDGLPRAIGRGLARAAWSIVGFPRAVVRFLGSSPRPASAVPRAIPAPVDKPPPLAERVGLNDDLEGHRDGFDLRLHQRNDGWYVYVEGVDGPDFDSGIARAVRTGHDVVDAAVWFGGSQARVAALSEDVRRAIHRAVVEQHARLAAGKLTVKRAPRQPLEDLVSGAVDLAAALRGVYDVEAALRANAFSDPRPGVRRTSLAELLRLREDPADAARAFGDKSAMVRVFAAMYLNRQELIIELLGHEHPPETRLEALRGLRPSEEARAAVVRLVGRPLGAGAHAVVAAGLKWLRAFAPDLHHDAVRMAAAELLRAPPTRVGELGIEVLRGLEAMGNDGVGDLAAVIARLAGVRDPAVRAVVAEVVARLRVSNPGIGGLAVVFDGSGELSVAAPRGGLSRSEPEGAAGTG